MRQETGDWEPLPDRDAAMHPGETVAAAPAAVAPAAPADPCGEAVLEALRQKLAAAPAADSFVAAIAAKERRQQRRQQAGAAPQLAELRPLQSDLRSAAELPLPVEFQQGRDPREDEPWFRALPPAEQRRLHAAWTTERERFADLPAQQRHERVERFWVAYVVFFFAGLPLLLVDGLAPFLTMAVGGFVTGLVWQLLPSDRFWSAGSAVVVYAAVMVVPRADVLVRFPFDAAVALFGGCLVGYLACLGAMTGEMQRSGGFKP